MTGEPYSSTWSITSQIGRTSRKRTYSADNSIATPIDSAQRTARITGTCTHVPCGFTPEASEKTSTTRKLRARLKEAVTTVVVGITSRGNWILRTSCSRSTTEDTAPLVASAKNV